MGRVPRWVLAEVIRVSPHGLLCGVAMSLWCYRLRDVDLPMPLIATVVAAPYYAVVGFVAGRRRDVTVGAVVGAAVAGIGFLVLCAAILVVPIDATGAWRDSGARLRDVLLVGPVFLVSVVAVGLVCGVSGAALAHARFTGESAREE